MARILTLPVILLLWASSEKPAPLITPIAGFTAAPHEPVPLSFRSRLTPAWYGAFPLGASHWELVSEMKAMLALEQCTTNQPHGPQPGPKGWYTFCRDGRPLILIQEREDGFCFYHDGPFWGFVPFGWLPRLLKEGSTWTSGSVAPQFTFKQSVSCVADGGQLRVDFLDPPRVVYSMWFDPDRGLVRCDGIDSTPIFQEPGNPTTSRLRQAAWTYTRNGLADDSKDAPPTDYIMHPPRPRPSASSDEATHGGKLVAMYPRERSSYEHLKDSDQYDGQFIVLESWIPGSVRKKGPLFIMLKSQGDWIYATADPEGRELIDWGKLPSCTKCHETKATRDRLFGVPREEDPH